MGSQRQVGIVGTRWNHRDKMELQGQDGITGTLWDRKDKMGLHQDGIAGIRWCCRDEMGLQGQDCNTDKMLQEQRQGPEMSVFCRFIFLNLCKTKYRNIY